MDDFSNVFSHVENIRFRLNAYIFLFEQKEWFQDMEMLMQTSRSSSSSNYPRSAPELT